MTMTYLLSLSDMMLATSRNNVVLPAADNDLLSQCEYEMHTHHLLCAAISQITQLRLTNSTGLILDA